MTDIEKIESEIQFIICRVVNKSLTKEEIKKYRDLINQKEYSMNNDLKIIESRIEDCRRKLRHLSNYIYLIP
jgi:hypothetical protein